MLGIECTCGHVPSPRACSTRSRKHWKRILVGAFVGWLFAVVGGAFALASLEFHGIVSTTTSDELGIIVVLYGVGIGALNAYTFRPVED